MAITINPGVPAVPDEFTDLRDVPGDYTGESGKLLAVKATEDGLEFIAGSGGAVDSVNGQTGVVVLDTDDIDEGATNLYATEANVGAIVNAASEKATLHDDDRVAGTDSEASNVLAWWKVSTIKATLKTYFDTLYTAINTAVLLTGTQTVAGVKTFSDAIIGHALRRASETSSLTLMGGTSETEGPFIRLMGKDVGGGEDGAIVYLATTESSAVGKHFFYISDGASALLRATVDINGIVTTGINFGAQTLDAYSYGTFTPVVADADTGGNTATGTFSGWYVKNGRTCNIGISLLNINTSGMTGANPLFIRGLPFAAQTATNYTATAALRVTAVTHSGDLIATLASGTSYVLINNNASNTDFDTLTVSDIFSSGVTDIWFSMTYITA